MLESRSPNYPNCVSIFESPTSPHTKPRTDFPALEEPVLLSETYPGHTGHRDCSHTCTRSMPTNHRKFR